MMHGSLLRLLGVGCAVVLAGACANGDDPSNSGFSITGVSNPTQATNPTNPTSESGSSTGAPTSGGGDTTSAPPVTTTGEDASTTNPASGTTTTGVDPSTTTTTTGVDPSTTTGVDPSTTTTTTDGTTSTTTGEPPPPKDPQPVAGLYEACLDNTPCDANVDGCFTLTDANMKVTDGYCTLLCDTVADCGTKPVCPAVQECLNIAAGQNVCALKCAGVKDCPVGMSCINISLPNNGSGMYCF
jgi:hypothetical protein